jgi:hypothetical protein
VSASSASRSALRSNSPCRTACRVARGRASRASRSAYGARAASVCAAELPPPWPAGAPPGVRCAGTNVLRAGKDAARALGEHGARVLRGLQAGMRCRTGLKDRQKTSAAVQRQPETPHDATRIPERGSIRSAAESGRSQVRTGPEQLRRFRGPRHLLAARPSARRRTEAGRALLTEPNRGSGPLRPPPRPRHAAITLVVCPNTSSTVPTALLHERDAGRA